MAINGAGGGTPPDLPGPAPSIDTLPATASAGTPTSPAPTATASTGIDQTAVDIPGLAAAVLTTPLAEPPAVNGPGGTTVIPPVPAETVPPVTRPPAPRPPAVLPAVQESPFVLFDAEGQPAGRFQSLEAACHVAKTGSVIEIHHHGPLDRVQKPVMIQGKRLTIRPAAGLRPQLSFAPADNLLGPSDARMIEVVNGSLELYDVDLVMEVTNNLYAEEWVLLSLTRVREVILLQRVTMTAVNPGWRPAVLIERRMPADTPTIMMPAVETLRDTDIQLRDCLLRGNATGFMDRTLEPAAVRISDSAIAVDVDVFHVQGADRAEMEGLSRSTATIRFELEHVTAIAGTSLLKLSSETVRDLPEVRVDCRNSILQAATSSVPLLLLEGHQNADDLLQHVRWFGNRNVIAFNAEEGCVVRGLFPQGSDDWTHSLSQWQAQWQPEWEITSEAITQRQVLTWEAGSGGALSDMQRSDFALKPMSIDEPANPAVGTASDNSDRGFRPSHSRLPPSLPIPAGL